MFYVPSLDVLAVFGMISNYNYTANEFVTKHIFFL